MGFACYLAMTAAEIRQTSRLPPKLAYMACHFSPYEAQLSNCPDHLPEGSILILNDLIPPMNHDPEDIRRQLLDMAQQFSCSALLLDFQRPEDDQTAAIAVHIARNFPCPAIVSSFYAKNLNCPVLLPPVPPDVSLEAHLSPWLNRTVWLELSNSPLRYCVTTHGSRMEQVSSHPESSLRDEKLCCHYHIEQQDDRVNFTIFRTDDDTAALLQKAGRMGIAGTIGLWQEFGKNFLPGK